MGLSSKRKVCDRCEGGGYDVDWAGRRRPCPQCRDGAIVFEDQDDDRYDSDEHTSFGWGGGDNRTSFGW